MTYSISNGNLKSRLYLCLIRVVIVLLLWIPMLGCARAVIIEGKYISQDYDDVSDITIQFSLNDLNANNEFHYRVRLHKDGSFHFKVREEGSYLLSAAIVDYSGNKWQSPRLSNDTNLIPIWIPNSGTIKLDSNYISNVIRIIKPSEGQKISLSGNFEFIWESNSLAQYYSLSLYSWKESGEPKAVVTVFNITGTNFKISDLFQIETVIGELDFKTIKGKGQFLRQGADLVPGDYGLSIRAYRAIEEKRFVNVARSPDEWRCTITE